MFEISQQIIAYFEDKIQFTDVCDNRIFAVIAPEDVVFPFAAFTINQFEAETKDADIFDVTLFLWFEQDKYTDAIKFTDACTELVRAKDEWDWKNSAFQFIEENTSYCGIINFNIL